MPCAWGSRGSPPARAGRAGQLPPSLSAGAAPGTARCSGTAEAGNLRSAGDTATLPASHHRVPFASVSRCRALKITPKQPYGSWQKNPDGKTRSAAVARFHHPSQHGLCCRKKFPHVRPQPTCHGQPCHHPAKRLDPPAPEAATGPAQSGSEPSSAAADTGGHFTPRANLTSCYIDQSCLEECNFVL